MNQLLGVTLAVFFSLPAHANTWDMDEDPSHFTYLDEKLETHFNALPRQATVTDTGAPAPWSETYWPSNRGGIAVRYLEDSEKNAKAFKASHPGLQTLRNMSVSEIRKLSPAEKFDIARGNYHYPLTNRVLNAYAKNDPYWNGICHGWAPAAASYPEPLPVAVVNKDGVRIEFGSSDIKALISFYYAWEAAQYSDSGEENWGFKKQDPENEQEKGVYFSKDPNMSYFIYRQVGQRCDRAKVFAGGCKGTTLNPAVFHLAITNIIGRYHRSFVANVFPKLQIWNQPVYGYKTTVLKTESIRPGEVDTDETNDDEDDGQEEAHAVRTITPASTAVTKVLVHTTFTYVDEMDPTFAIKGKPKTDKKEMAYWLELDPTGKIVGGRWSRGLFRSREKKTSFIGFMWRASRVPFLGDFLILNDIYKPVSARSDSYAGMKNFTPGLQDTYFEVNSSTIPTFSLNTYLGATHKTKDDLQVFTLH